MHSACSKPTLPWPPRFQLQQWKRRLPSVYQPGQKTRVAGSMPASSAAIAVTILNVEPGGYWPETILLVRGCASSDSSSSHRSAGMPCENTLGSKLGYEQSA